jgi:hypothetical protein
MPGNPNYATDLLTTTFEVFLSKQPKDAIFQDIPLWDVLNKRSKTRRKGGIKLLTPLRYAKSTSGGSYSGWDRFDISPQEGLTNAEFDWKWYYWSITINGEEMQKNSSEAAMIDLLQAKWDQAKDSMSDKMGSDIFLDGTANANKAITGLALAVDNAGTYGNIQRASNVWWQAVENGNAVAIAAAGANGWRRMFNDCSYGRMKQTPNLIITTQEGFESYEALMDTNMRYTNVGEQNVGFANPNLMFRNAPVFWDDYCQDGAAYFLNTNFLELVVSSDRDMTPGAFKVPIDQDSRVAQILWGGQMTCSNCRHQGKFTALTNA